MNVDVSELLERIKRFKVGDPVRLAAVCGFAIGLVLFGVLLSALVRGAAERRTIQAEYDSTQKGLREVQGAHQAEPEQLRQRLDEVQLRLRGMMAQFPTLEQSGTALWGYYQMAEQFDAELARMEAIPVSADGEAESPYKMERFALEIRGETGNLMRLMEYLTGESYDTFVFEEINISPDGPSRADVRLTVYSANLAGPVSAAQ